MNTIKDIKQFDLPIKNKYYEYEQGKQYALIIMRQSAIEDIKQYHKEIEEIYQAIKSDEHKPTTNLCKICRMGSYDCTCRAKRKSKIEYIKEKFNITEEDLK